MHRFIVKVIFIIASSIITYALLVLLVIGLNKSKYKDFPVDKSVTGLIIGDSHTHWALDDDSIPNVLNVSLNGEGYIYSYSKLNYILSSPNNIKTIYLGCSYHNLSSYFDEYIFGSHSENIIGKYIIVLTLNDYLVLLKNNPIRALRWFNSVILDGVKGLKPADTTFNNNSIGEFPGNLLIGNLDKSSVERRISEQYYLNEDIIPFSQLNIFYLKKIVKYSIDNDLNIILVNTPMHPSYNERIPLEYKLKYDFLVSEFGVTLLDLNTMDIPDSCFMSDGDHVNFEGARLTTKYFVSSITAQQKLRDSLNKF